MRSETKRRIEEQERRDTLRPNDGRQLGGQRQQVRLADDGSDGQRAERHLGDA
jgi:hypothetical protein